MRRGPFVLAGTGAGLLAVLGYHTAGLTPTAARSVAAGPGPVAGGGSNGSGSSTTTTTTNRAGATTTTAPGAAGAAPTTSTTAPTTRRANGQDVTYRYGELQLQVTVKGNRITSVEPLVNQGFDPRSEQINQEAVPLLRQEVLQAQSANIDGVSGATYTSVAYQESLQAALDSLHFK